MDSSGVPDLCSPKLTNTSTLDLWRDGLLCAYEFLPAISRKIKVGGEFNAHGPLQGRFDAEISLKPNDISEIPRVESKRSSSELSSPKSSSGTEVQGLFVQESLKKEKLSASGGRLDHQRSGKKGHSQWVPIGWQRLVELFQGIQVRIRALCKISN